MAVTKISPIETKAEYTIQVTSNDGKNDISKNFTIYVNNLNEPPTNIELSNSSVNENVDIGFEIGTFTTTDEDLVDTIISEYHTLTDFPISVTGNYPNNDWTDRGSYTKSITSYTGNDSWKNMKIWERFLFNWVEIL